MGLIEKLDQEIIEHLKKKDESTVSTLRLIKNSLKNQRINSGNDLTEADELVILQKEAKQRRESIESYTKAGRDDLVAKEEQELMVIQRYLPEMMSEGEILVLVDAVIKESGSSSPADMGRVMGALKPRVAGRADGAVIASIVRERLASS
jgi:uncharacterized protein